MRVIDVSMRGSASGGVCRFQSGPIRAMLCAWVAVYCVAVAATPTVDGYFDPAWAGGGRIEFNADTQNAAASTGATKIIATGNGNLLVRGSAGELKTLGG